MRWIRSSSEDVLERAQRFAAAGGFDGLVPRAADILALWADTLALLRAKDLSALSGRVDWIRKLFTLERALEKRSDLGWDAPAIKHLDFLYASLDREQGLYWAHEQRGDVEMLVSEAEIERFVHEPPEDTRAWTRAMLLRIAGARGVQDVDWDAIRFRKAVPGYWAQARILRLADPLEYSKAHVADVIQRAATLDDILDALEASPSVSESTPSLYEWNRESADAPRASGGRQHNA